MRVVAVGCLGFVTSVGLPSQATHLVGPGGLPQISDALAIAAPGDAIHVLPGAYAHFTANVGVGIRALVPGTVTVQFDPAFESPGCIANPFCAVTLGPTRFEPPAGQAVHVVGVTFAPTPTPTFSRHRVLVASGTVTFDDCTIQAMEAVALSIGSAQVHLQGCTVQALGLAPQAAHALIADGANLTLVDCLIAGNDTLGTFPGDAVRLTNCTLKASGCFLAGGTIQFGGPDGAALRTDHQSRVWISDSTLEAGGSGDCAIVGTPAVGHIARSTVSSGGTGCGTLLPAPVVGVERPTWIQNGAAFAVHVRTEPNTIVAIHASPHLAHLDLPAWFEQPIWLDLTAFFLAGVFVADGNGDVTATWSVPAGQYIDATVWLEAMVFLPGSRLLVGPVVGGVIR